LSLVKLMRRRGEGRLGGGESVAVPSSIVQEHMVGKRPVTLRREQTDLTLQSDDVKGASGTVKLNIEKAVEIRRYSSD